MTTEFAKFIPADGAEVDISPFFQHLMLAGGEEPEATYVLLVVDLTDVNFTDGGSLWCPLTGSEPRTVLLPRLEFVKMIEPESDFQIYQSLVFIARNGSNTFTDSFMPPEFDDHLSFNRAVSPDPGVEFGPWDGGGFIGTESAGGWDHPQFVSDKCDDPECDFYHSDGPTPPKSWEGWV